MQIAQPPRPPLAPARGEVRPPPNPSCCSEIECAPLSNLHMLWGNGAVWSALRANQGLSVEEFKQEIRTLAG